MIKIEAIFEFVLFSFLYNSAFVYDNVTIEIENVYKVQNSILSTIMKTINICCAII